MTLHLGPLKFKKGLYEPRYEARAVERERSESRNPSCGTQNAERALLCLLAYKLHS